ncbi:hypothetical protein ABK905_24880 [Acerihabitans sp. KWT182]|uniref:FUSC family protein n=1 Tax=Acerihabitans sp. KWT182 TaxID=3157919 RepID=A0AAU7QBE8_9GAMM
MRLTTLVLSWISRRSAWTDGHIFSIAPEQLGMEEGVRASAAMAVMLCAAVALDNPMIAYGAIAAFWNCLCDPFGSAHARLKTMASFTILGVIVMPLAAYGAGFGPFAAGVSLFLLVFVCGLTRSYGPALGPMPAQGGGIDRVHCRGHRYRLSSRTDGGA